MKKLFTLFISLAFCAAASATNYPGNGKTGFGGPVGTGSLDITTASTIITFTLNRGTGNMNDVLVIYMDAGAGGATGTAAFNDQSSGLMKAISGVDGTNRSDFTFSPNFTPEFAIAMMPNSSGGAVVAALGTTAHTVLGMPVLTNNGMNSAASYSISFDVSALFGTGPINFKFIGTLISNTGYRSDEAFGDSMTNFTQGWNPHVATQDPLIFNSAMPVTLSSFTGTMRDHATILNWNTKSELNAASYSVERKMNNSEWNMIGSVIAKNYINGAAYTYTNVKAEIGTAYYRLKMLDKDGHFIYSNVVKMDGDTRSHIVIMNNPAKSEVRLNIVNASAAKYDLSLYSMDGRKISDLNYTHSGGVSTLTMPLNAKKGMYILTAVTGSERQSYQVLVN